MFSEQYCISYSDSFGSFGVASLSWRMDVVRVHVTATMITDTGTAVRPTSPKPIRFLAGFLIFLYCTAPLDA